MAVLEQQVLALSPRQTHTFPGGSAYTFRKIGDAGDISVWQGGKVKVLEGDTDEVHISHQTNGDVYVAVGEEGGSIHYFRQETEHPNDGLADQDNPGLGEPDPADAPILQHPDKNTLVKDPGKVLPPEDAREEPTFDRGLSLADRLRAEEAIPEGKEILPGVSAEGKREFRAGGHQAESLVSVAVKDRRKGTPNAGDQPPKEDAKVRVKKGVPASTASTGGRARSLDKAEKGDKGKTRSQKSVRDNVSKETARDAVPEAKRDVRKKRKG
jgi:hypothetical protein